jgi:hypothetical protein
MMELKSEELAVPLCRVFCSAFAAACTLFVIWHVASTVHDWLNVILAALELMRKTVLPDCTSVQVAAHEAAEVCVIELSSVCVFACTVVLAEKRPPIVLARSLYPWPRPDPERRRRGGKRGSGLAWLR